MRIAEIKRDTNETKIRLKLNIDGNGMANIDTGLPFFDHMLVSFAKHSKFDLDLNVKGDIDVDYHHTIEDTGIVLGKAFNNSLNDRSGIERFGYSYVPLDEALSRVVVDISGRPFLYFNVNFPRSDDGSNINPYLFEEFFRGFVNNALVTLHIDCIRGNNSHHIIESIFKSFAKSLFLSSRISGKDIPSTKGVL
ncbi:MAG TPA: imidazoleglycerol-phosphate dehydratase HisB [Spirochaetota bacterium]|nr:imidazoleglycerol-phosphate dehydratase HisB [Spirochaetota bacterium]HOL57203.1 imidazoleglycerol-phosphate dehydratase HisB [Spirochaetota bacterium]HPP04840.1 imidazoleglycerol-phosphate dehydratase HisB [Spirochaetota bacterium]